MFQTPVDSFFPYFLRAQNMVRVIEGEVIQKMTWGGNENWFELAGVRDIMGFELPRVKLQWMYNGNPGEIDFGWVNARFKLVRIWVVGSRLYNHAASCYSRTKLSRNQSWVNLLFSVLQDSILDLILDSLLSILGSLFAQESRIANRVKNQDLQWTVNLLLNGTVNRCKSTATSC